MIRGMQLTINGFLRTVPNDETTTVTDLLLQQQVPSPEMVAVRINGRIVPRSRYDSTNLSNGDTVDFLYFMGGGSSGFRGSGT